MKCDAPQFTPNDYVYIMQCRDIKPRYKILKELLDKYKTSSKRIYQIWRGEEANRVLWDQPIPHSYDDDDDESNRNTKCLGVNQLPDVTSSSNISDSTMNVLHIESQPLNNVSVNSSSHCFAIEPAQPNKQTKTKKSKPDRISNPLVISKDSTEKIDADTVAQFRRAVGESRNLTNSEYKID